MIDQSKRRINMKCEYKRKTTRGDEWMSKYNSLQSIKYFKPKYLPTSLIIKYVKLNQQ